MNMLLHGVENPSHRTYRDSLAQEHGGRRGKVLVGTGQSSVRRIVGLRIAVPRSLLQVIKTKKTELLFMALFLRLLKPGGRAAIIVPDGVLFGSSKAHKTLRKMIGRGSEAGCGIISMPGGVFKPYAGVSTAIRVVHQDQLGRHRSTFGSTTCRPMVCRSTTSGTELVATGEARPHVPHTKR